MQQAWWSLPWATPDLSRCIQAAISGAPTAASPPLSGHPGQGALSVTRRQPAGAVTPRRTSQLLWRLAHRNSSVHMHAQAAISGAPTAASPPLSGHAGQGALTVTRRLPSWSLQSSGAELGSRTMVGYSVSPMLGSLESSLLSGSTPRYSLGARGLPHPVLPAPGELVLPFGLHSCLEHAG